MYSPRARSESSWPTLLYAQSESCSPQPTLTKCTQKYVTLADGFKMKGVRATFSEFPSHTYVYCENDPTYTEQAASAVWIDISGTATVGSAHPPAWLQIGIKKARAQGASNPPLIKVYVEMNVAGLLKPEFLKDVITAPAGSLPLRIDIAGDGTPSFYVDDNLVQLTVGYNQGDVDPDLWKYIKTLNTDGSAAGVEVHDNRSQAPGVGPAPYAIQTVQYQKVGETTWHDDLTKLGASGPDCTGNIHIEKSGNFLLIWDDRVQ